MPALLASVAGVLLLVVLAVLVVTGGRSTGGDDDRVRVLLIGDSITHGQAGDWTWRFRLWERLQAAGESDIDLVGPADDLRNGSRDYRDPDFDQDHAALWGAHLTPPVYDPEELGRELRPDVVVIELGVNDLGGQGESPVEIAAAMEDTIGALRGASPGVDVVLVHVPLVGLVGVEELNQRYDDLAEELDTEDERVVVALADDGFVSDPSAPDSDTYDGIHPSARGEIKIAEAVAAALAELGIGDDGT